MKTSLAQRVAETLDQLGYHFEVIGTTTTTDRRYLRELSQQQGVTPEELEAQYVRSVPTLTVIFKSFNESLRSCRGRFASIRAHEGYTPLNESVIEAGHRLLKVKASRRLLVVITDGACYLGSTGTQAVAQRNLVDNLQLLGRAGVETVAVGIEASYVLAAFQHAAVVKGLEELPSKFFELVSRRLLPKR